MRVLLRMLSFCAPALGALLLIALWPEALRSLEARPSAAALIDVLRIAAWATPIAVALSAWHHGRSRLSFGCLSLAAIALAVWRDPHPRGEALEALPALFLAAAVSFALTATFDERGILTRSGGTRLLVLAALLGGVLLALEEAPGDLALQVNRLEAFELGLPGAVWHWCLGLVFALGLIALWAFPRPDRLEVGCSLFLSALCGQLSLGLSAGMSWMEGGQGLPATVLLLAGTMTLVLGLYSLSWRHANVDGLTGLPSRRALDERLPKLGRTYCLAVVDIDHFKKVNDKHGHPAGDAVLTAVAQRLARFRQGTVYRSGGEEFTIVCPGAELDALLVELDALRETVAREGISTPRLPGRSGASKRFVRVTVSIGAAPRSSRNRSPHRVLAAADEALLRAKKRGRNRVESERRSRSDRVRRRSRSRTAGGRR